MELLTRYQLGYPLTQRDKDHHLPVTESASEIADDRGTVYEMNDRYLEVCDSRYADRGIVALMSTVIGSAAIVICGTGLWMMTHIPHVYVERGQVKLAVVLAGLFSAVGAGFFTFMLILFCKDCFSYTRYPIRLDRINQMVYAFKKNGPSGTLRVPWNKVFFFIESRVSGPGTYSTQYAIRGNVLDDSGRVVDTFTIGKCADHLREDGKFNRFMLRDLLATFEFYRRYMESGGEAVPRVEKCIPTETSFKNSLAYSFRWAADWKEDVAGFFGLLFLLYFMVGVVPCLALSIFHYLAMVTSRPPTWPEDVEHACSPPRELTECIAS